MTYIDRSRYRILDSISGPGLHPGEIAVYHVDGQSPVLYFWDHVNSTWRKVHKDGDVITVENILMESGSQLFQDYLVPAFSLRQGSSAPDLENLRDGLYMSAFNGTTTMEQSFFSIHILHDIRNSTNPTFHVHWTHKNASPTGSVKWNIEYTYAHGYELQAYPETTILSTTETAGAQYEHHITNDDDMIITDELMVDGQIIGRIYRDPTDVADTFADDAFLIGVDMHYEIGQWGTPERNQPFSYGNAV